MRTDFTLNVFTAKVVCRTASCRKIVEFTNLILPLSLCGKLV